MQQPPRYAAFCCIWWGLLLLFYDRRDKESVVVAVELQHGGKVDARGQRDLFGVDLQDLLAALEVGQLHGHPAVKAAGPGQGRVKGFGTVGGGQNDDTGVALKAIHLGHMVIGGGDTGNDCVGTSMRHGAKSVLQLEMMPKAPDERTEMNPWPEWPRVCKTDYGQQEAAAVFGHDPRVYQTTVKEFKKDKNGKVCKAVLVKLEPKKDEKTGRMMMAEVAGSEYTVDVDLVLIAAGFLGSQDYVTKAFGVEVNERTNVKTAAGAYSTNVKNVFTAGDMHRGQSLVVWAIREGREAAKAVDISLMGYTNMYVQ